MRPSRPAIAWKKKSRGINPQRYEFSMKPPSYFTKCHPNLPHRSSEAFRSQASLYCWCCAWTRKTRGCRPWRWSLESGSSGQCDAQLLNVATRRMLEKSHLTRDAFDWIISGIESKFIQLESLRLRWHSTLSTMLVFPVKTLLSVSTSKGNYQHCQISSLRHSLCI
jgi:hypothetical protein